MPDPFRGPFSATVLGAFLATCVAAANTGLAKFEPTEGCYLGAFIEHDAAVRGDFDRFEALVGHRHACYMTYSGYGQPFPAAWVARVAAHGAAAHLGWEPNQGLDQVQDDAYLREWARAARATGIPIFLRFASEMNGSWMPYSGDPTLFIAKWRLVARVMREEAPNVALVWCVFATPQRTIPLYYPGDDWVDWVGVNIYSVVYHNNDPSQPARQEDPRDALRFVYDRWSARKPIMIAEYAATSWCRVVGGPTTDFAVGKMSQLYRSLIDQFPRVKCVQWFSWDTIASRAADNNYSLTADPAITACYRRLTDGPHWLGRVVADPALLLPSPESVHPRLVLGPHDPRPAEPAVVAAAPGEAETRFALPIPAIEAPFAPAPPPDLSELRPLRSEFGFRELRPGAEVSRRVSLSVYLPLDWKVRYLGLEVDGRVVMMSNRPPYRFDWDTSGLEPGRHIFALRVWREGIDPVVSPPLEVEVRRRQ